MFYAPVPILLYVYNFVFYVRGVVGAEYEISILGSTGDERAGEKQNAASTVWEDRPEDGLELCSWVCSRRSWTEG